jgi:hypothetical protein
MKSVFELLAKNLLKKYDRLFISKKGHDIKKLHKMVIGGTESVLKI